MEMLDTRGFAESEAIDSKNSAEDALLDQVIKFSPDVALFVLDCSRRDDLKRDVEFLKKLAKNYHRASKIELPIITVMNKADEMRPARIKEPAKYTQEKEKNIKEKVKHDEGFINDNGLKIDGIIAVSSLVDWATKDGNEISVEAIEKLLPQDIEQLVMEFDGRYQIEKLRTIMEEVIKDFEAQAGFRLALKLKEVVKRFAKKLTNVFATISGLVGSSPIPVSDVYILLTIQSYLVCIIAALGGRDISLKSATELIFSFVGVAGAGTSLRLGAQQIAKLVPGIGTLASAVIAASGTWAVGSAAIKYYIDGIDIETIKKDFPQSNDDNAKYLSEI